MRKFKRKHHDLVAHILNMMSLDFLESSQCYFGGGTRIVLELAEYRESVDVDFVCASQHGYRQLRNEVTESSLGALFDATPQLLRDVKADMYGVRTFIAVEGKPVKFEIIREARISISGMKIASVAVPCLDHVSCLAEKFLANTDRGLDKATRSRDLIDLAFMAADWSDREVKKGFELAEEAYGASVSRTLRSTLDLFSDKSHRNHCVADLGVDNSRHLTRGLKKLQGFS